MEGSFLGEDSPSLFVMSANVERILKRGIKWWSDLIPARTKCKYKARIRFSETCWSCDESFSALIYSSDESHTGQKLSHAHKAGSSQPRKGQGSEQWGLLQKLFLQIIWNRWWRWWCNNDEDASIQYSHLFHLQSIHIHGVSPLPSQSKGAISFHLTLTVSRRHPGIFTWDVGSYFFSLVLATMKYWLKGIWDGGGVEMHKIRECRSMIFCASG